MSIKNKILDVQKLSQFRKKNPNKKIVLCHGVFDVVHPGHVRHLAYAKTKADILVVSITADRFITKGIYRPHIPQKLRALNLPINFNDIFLIYIFFRPIFLTFKSNFVYPIVYLGLHI